MEFNNENDRNALRMLVVEQLSHELCGQGKGEKATHYIYYMENIGIILAMTISSIH
jgi:hypothetical protein